MSSAAQAKFDGSMEMDFRTYGDAPEAPVVRAVARPHDISFDIYDSLPAVEQIWRSFERYADCTVFQAFEWLSTWQHHIGIREGARPLVVVGCDPDGKTLFILPLAVTPRRYGKLLSFLGSGLCDYNAPLLAPDFAQHVPEPLPLIQQVFERLRADFGYELVHLEKMPETVGAQGNPLMKLPAMLHPSGAYATPLGTDWETFYREKRSSSTRQRDRGKRKKLGRFGEVRIVHPVNDAEITATLDTLMVQKGRTFARMGIANIFARPGYREFYRAMATGPATRRLTHVSRLQVGDEIAAANLGLTFRDRYYYVLVSYGDGDMSRFSPGAVHLRDLMQFAIHHGFRIFDFTVGDEPYKRGWCDESPLYDHIAGVGARSAAIAAGLRAVGALKRRIKRTPSLRKLAFKAREVLGRLRRRGVL